ncbi:MAG: DNA repair protein RecO C-terminal domain-containing protein, partial [Candidatus Kerfeldbacteria bacterium]|nr:DNA repair protein RecO C-terminal domain-containing protein [Candidatus Kerfeldbacteria bacterium]
ELVVAGGQKSISKLAPHLQPFSEVELMVAPGQKLDHLAAASLRRVYLKPPYSLPTVVLATSFLEVADMLAQPGQAENNLFLLLRRYVSELQKLTVGTAWRPGARNLLASFLLEVISSSGLGPHLRVCEACGGELGKEAVCFSWPDHGFYHQACLKPGLTAVAVTSATVAWLTRRAGDESGQPQDALAFLTDYFQGHMGRELYTLKVLRSILEVCPVIQLR